MAFCYRFKLRVSLPRSKLADKIISFSVSVPRKCRRLSRGRFAYSALDSDCLEERPVSTLLSALKSRLLARKYQQL